MFKATKASKIVGPQRYKPMLEVLKAASNNVGRKANMYDRQWPCSIGFLPISHSISKAPNSPKHLDQNAINCFGIVEGHFRRWKGRPKCMVVGGHGFLVPLIASYSTQQSTNIDPKNIWTKNAINQCQQY
jgi:hypothetical protein